MQKECFFHNDKEGVYTCKKCQNNYCEQCGKMSQYSGVCPACYRQSLFAQKKKAESNLTKSKINMISYFLGTVLGVVLALVAPMISGLAEQSQSNLEVVGLICAAVFAALCLWAVSNFFQSKAQIKMATKQQAIIKDEFDKILQEMKEQDRQ